MIFVFSGKCGDTGAFTGQAGASEAVEGDAAGDQTDALRVQRPARHGAACVPGAPVRVVTDDVTDDVTFDVDVHAADAAASVLLPPRDGGRGAGGALPELPPRPRLRDLRLQRAARLRRPHLLRGAGLHDQPPVAGETGGPRGRHHCLLRLLLQVSSSRE